jgi:hypothetical protein
VDQTIRKERPVGQAGEGIVEGLMGELILERFTLGEVLEHEPYLQQSLGLVPDGIDERLQPARPRLGRRLAEQNWRGHLAVLPTLFKVWGKPHGAQPLILEDARALREPIFSPGPQSVPGGIYQQVPTVGIENGGG